MKAPWIGLLAAMLVLFVIPLGHALMVLLEHFWPDHRYIAAGTLGFAGVGLLVTGVRWTTSEAWSAVLGFSAGMVVWTGWVEFSFVWIATKLSVAPALDEMGNVSTKPEYLVMMSSLGLLAALLMPLAFAPTRCTMFSWFQRFLGGKPNGIPPKKPLAVILFLESITLVWFFYVLLLLTYDEEIAGTQHWAAYLVAFGSLLWSLYLFRNLLAISVFSYALRYAIPTVIIFWNFVEVLGRWGIIKELWIHPLEHWVENSLIALAFGIFILSVRLVPRRSFEREAKVM